MNYIDETLEFTPQKKDIEAEHVSLFGLFLLGSHRFSF